MVKYLIFYFFYISLLTKVFSLKPGADFGKYEKASVSSTDGFVVFDSSEFNTGDHIYFKIKCSYFLLDYIEYEFLDDLSKADSFFGTEYCYSTLTDTEYEYGVPVRETKYYTIKKDNIYLGSSNGDYLVLYLYCGGANISIENTKEDQSNIGLIVGIVVGIIALVVIIIIIVYCCRRQRKLAMMQANPVYSGSAAVIPQPYDATYLNNMPVNNAYIYPNNASPQVYPNSAISNQVPESGFSSKA